MNRLLERYVLKNYDTISFDIFDTLIERNVSDPREIFVKVGEEYFHNEKNDFVKSRIAAEKNARKIKKNNEADLDDIYIMLSEYYPDKDITMIKKIEEKTEIDAVYPKQKVVDLYNRCVAMGKKVYIISDMYLKENTIKNMLHKCGIEGYEKLYVSNVYNKTKASGQLFSTLITEKHIIKKQHIHIGDSFISDILGARKCDLRAVLVYRKNFLKRKVYTIIGRYK